ncbi:MAG: beta-propeller fold lactonase family protein [Proteobacteria bacterium]|nr:beta-propeller fold lactonase family protein [Pseudomonadota bacterium]MCP4919291.1 beta-propeller fold lactonase family protein [Pseudomonadota bacterium]
MLLLLTACLESRPPPFVGDCATYPSGAFDYGQIGIGTCLAGPMSMDWVDGHLVVANANPFLDFTGGSVLSIDVATALGQAGALDDRRVLTSDVAVSAVPMPSFPSYAAYVADRDLMLVPNRLSEEARTRVGFDDVYFVDVSDPAALAFAAVGPDGAEHIELESDPALVAVDDTTGLAFVANLTSHSISVVDTTANPIDAIDAVGVGRGTLPRFVDADGSGSRADATEVVVFDPEALIDQEWSLSYSDGSYRLWVPELGGASRLSSVGDDDWRASAMGVEVDLADTDGVIATLSDPQSTTTDDAVTRLYFIDGADVRVAEAEVVSGEWAYYEDPFLYGREDGWDVTLGGPMTVIDDGEHRLYYDGTDADGAQSIGLAHATDGFTFRRDNAGEPILSVEGTKLADPFVLYDLQADLWRMYMSLDDGTGWVVGSAASLDGVEWTLEDAAAFVPQDGSVGAAAPVVTYGNYEFRMWTSRLQDDGTWALGSASSVDGENWTDLGLVDDLVGLDASTDATPGVGLQAVPMRSFLLEGDQIGPTSLSIHGGDTLLASSLGFAITLSAGASIDTQNVGDEGINGVQADTWLVDEQLVYATLTDGQGSTSIAVLPYDGAEAGAATPVFEAGTAPFDGSVSTPVVFDNGNGYTMLVAGELESRTAIASATSTDGLTWTMGDIVLDSDNDWESLLLAPGHVEVEDDGSFTLLYTGSDGSRSRIGQATSTDGLTWTRVEGADDPWVFGNGSPGEFDDSAVRHPTFVVVDEVEHLYYAGFDGDFWRIGHASRAVGDVDWVRDMGVDDEPRAVLEGLTGNFDARDAYRPLVHWDGASFSFLYTGRDAGVERVGRAVATHADRVYRDPARPTVGDAMVFTTYTGDGGRETAITLERTVEGFTALGLAVSTMHLDEARGFLYVATKLSNYVYVIDVRDDSTSTWDDTNFLGLEALMVANADVGASNFRGLSAPADSDYLFALNGQPESILLVDLSEVEDNDRADLYLDAVNGFLAAPRGLERDAGVGSMSSVGPAGLAVVGDRLYVSNFNANSIGVYDLRLGIYGELIDEVSMVGENPHTLSVSPDGTQLAVANYLGEVIDGRASSSIVLLDIDPDSPGYLDVLARVVNE